MFDNFLTWDISGEVISSLIAMGIVVIFYVVVGLLARRADPLKKSKGLVFVGETLVSFFDGLASRMMGPKFKEMGGFIMAIASYLFIAFIFGLTGLPSPVTYLGVPLSLALVTFGMIHITSIRFTKWKYFKRYIEPVPVFLPVNLLSMWAPVLSLSLRLFGNALSGWVIMTLIYGGLSSLKIGVITWMNNGSSEVFSLIAPVITPVLHAYFDLFSGLIQTTVFIFLTMIFISQEAPMEEVEEKLYMEGGR